MFMNMKGGVGKTTLAVEISRTLAYDYDKDVLLIDYDPQANASLAFLEPSEYFSRLDEGKSIAHCLLPSPNRTILSRSLEYALQRLLIFSCRLYREYEALVL